MDTLKSQKQEKIFRIWLMGDLNNRRYCEGINFRDLSDNIIYTFQLSNNDSFELRNGADGTIIQNDFDFNQPPSESILILLNKSKNEEWTDSIVTKIKLFSPGGTEYEQQQQQVTIQKAYFNKPKCVTIGNENIISKNITTCHTNTRGIKDKEV